MSGPSTSRPTLDDLDRLVTVRIARLARLLRYRMDEQLAAHGLTGVQLGLLTRLLSTDGLVQAELGRRMAIEPATLTGIVQRLEREGWVRRTFDPDNRRLQRVWLTEKARADLPMLQDLQERHRQRALAGLGTGDLAKLEALLDQIEGNLQS